MSNTVKGVAPGFLLIPAREYEWELVKKVQLEVPNSGRIKDLLSEKELAEGVTFPGEDEFSIFEDNLLLLWEIVRVLFAQIKYPSLEDDQCMNVVALQFSGDIITIHGEIIRYI